jgi:hypothetical protein
MPKKGTPYPRELRERVVRLVLEHEGEYWVAVGGDLFCGRKVRSDTGDGPEMGAPS